MVVLAAELAVVLAAEVTHASDVVSARSVDSPIVSILIVVRCLSLPSLYGYHSQV